MNVIKHKGTTKTISDNLLEPVQITKNAPKLSIKFGSPSLYYDGIYYFYEDIKDSSTREGRPFEIQIVYYRGKWYQDTFYMTSEFKEFICSYIPLS